MLYIHTYRQTDRHTNKHFNSEKVNLEFEKFLKNEEVNRRNISEERLNTLVEHLNSFASTDNDKIAVIKQAIGGNYPDFRPLPGSESKLVDYSGNSSSVPSVHDFIKYFEENGSTQVKAEKFYDSCAYIKKWKDKAGFSFIETWKEYATNYIKKQ
jgi:hypothetical protein